MTITPTNQPLLGVSIGVDLDEVVFGYLAALREYAHENYGIPLEKMTGPATYSLSESGWFDSEEQFKEIHSAAVNDGLYTRLKMIEGASDMLWKLSNEGANLHVITSRYVINGQHRRVTSDTVLSLDENNIPYRSLTFTAWKRNVSADVFIDDSPRNVTSLREAGRFVIVMDMPYNRDLEGPRAKDWDDVYRIIHEMER